ncbi:sulfide/dihydroorotate dehydrogenase-like FAD/NAD-binding protein [Thermotoga sp.]|uniref:sulfide/dihydroorotate dehydrogenase-like FAD/NAD-binding protein n=1 Tax=Thermotoga sp. TaxID=28240 RepID=UPI0025E987CA|nr:sulfide/dihydroorotate dehydrogenase-like FAD/NAD-binding protein [Thermotoga sp.]MCD6552033.1 sulfide/dihydroorotate dehydrogenase-like FAD/NAD-binding protein [Thermotoga sp.]
MNEIVMKKRLAADVFDFWIHTPAVSREARPGQFVVVRLHERGERIPLTIADTNPNEGIFRMVVKVVGKTTHELSLLEEGESILDVVGPLGNPSEIRNYGNVLLVGGGVGIATLYPIARALKKAGNRITAILGARSKGYLIMADEFEEISEVVLVTDDGSAGMKGVVTDAMDLLLKERSFDFCWAVGPTIMMKFCTLKAMEYGVPIWVSLNPIMVDGTGMCGACRVTVCGKIKFACVDGPEFRGEEVDWDELLKRLSQYREQEKLSYERFLKTAGETE